MKRLSIFSLFIVFIGLTISCGNTNSASTKADNKNEAAFDLSKMEKYIKEETNKFTQAHITGDTAFLNNVFARDARAYPPNSEMVTGRTAIAAVNLEWVNYGIKEFTEESTHFYGNEEYLIDEGNYYYRFGEDDITDKGKYINIWKKENGQWKIYSNIWNSSLP